MDIFHVFDISKKKKVFKLKSMYIIFNKYNYQNHNL